MIGDDMLSSRNTLREINPMAFGAVSGRDDQFEQDQDERTFSSWAVAGVGVQNNEQRCEAVTFPSTFSVNSERKNTSELADDPCLPPVCISADIDFWRAKKRVKEGSNMSYT